MTKRIGILALLHESNTFLHEPTDLTHFQLNLLTSGDAVCAAFRNTPHEVGGFLQAIDETPEVKAVGIFAARAMPYGPISADCWDQLCARLQTALQAALPLDGLLVAPHGATVAENAADADGDWLSRVRQIVGPELPIVGTLDLHANVSAKMASACDALFGYRSNPHLDQFARGLQAGRCLIRALSTGIRPQMSLVQLPLCVNIERQATEEPQGLQLRERADQLAATADHVHGLSYLFGFPYSDVPEMGASVLAVADSADVAHGLATDLANFWWSHREDFAGHLVSVEQAIAEAVRQGHSDGPVGLLDMGDNVGGGSPGDGTWIAHAWLQHGQGPCLTVLADAAAVSRSEAAGIGNSWSGPIGARVDPLRHGPPLEDEWTVLGLADGKFHETEARHGGYSRFDQGLTAVLRGRRGLIVQVTTLRMAPLSLQQVLSAGIRPEQFAAVVLKGVHAPVAAWRSVCSRLIRVNTDGVTTADLGRLTFARRRVPMYPFEPAVSWQAE
ncbi:MAG: M81 family metallopeptidase [Planctomycetota bacterium]